MIFGWIQIIQNCFFISLNLPIEALNIPIKRGERAQLETISGFHENKVQLSGGSKYQYKKLGTPSEPPDQAAVQRWAQKCAEKVHIFHFWFPNWFLRLTETIFFVILLKHFKCFFNKKFIVFKIKTFWFSNKKSF